MVYGFYDVSTKELWKKRVWMGKANGFVWGTDFPKHEPTYEEAKAWYHGNSKLILHLMYNNITCRKEMVVTTKAIIKTYPQYKGKVIEVI